MRLAAAAEPAIAVRRERLLSCSADAWTVDADEVRAYLLSAKRLE